MNAIGLYKIGNYCHKRKIPLIPFMTKVITFLLFNSVIPYTAEIGKGTRFGYGAIAVVVHSNAEIGRNCIIGTCVTIGGNKREQGVPKIKDNVYIATGAKILGNIEIGEGSFIGANSVVTRSIPPKSLVSGIPGKVIKENIDISDYSKYY